MLDMPGLSDPQNYLVMLTNGRLACPGSQSQGLVEARFECGSASWKAPVSLQWGQERNGAGGESRAQLTHWLHTVPGQPGNINLQDLQGLLTLHLTFPNDSSGHSKKIHTSPRWRKERGSPFCSWS